MVCRGHGVWAEGSGLDLIFHPIASPLDEHGFGMVEEAVEDCRGERAVIVEYLWPVFEGPVGSDDDRASFIALRNDLEEKIGPMFVDGQIAQLVEEEHGRRQVFFELGFEAIGGLSGGQGVDGIDGRGEKDGVAFEAGLVAECGGQMSLSEADACQEDDIGFVFDELESEQVLYGQSVDFVWPVPLKLLKGLAAGKSCESDFTLNGAVPPGVELTEGKVLKVVDVVPLIGGGLLGQGFTMLKHEGKAQQAKMIFEAGLCGLGGVFHGAVSFAGYVFGESS